MGDVSWGWRLVRAAFLVALTTVIAASWLAFLPGSARAEGERWAITRYQAVATAEAASGDTVIVLDFDFDFGDEAGHGPLLVFPERVPNLTTGRQSRELETTIESVTSSTGASVEVQTTRRRGDLRVRIGDPDVSVTGVQSYQVRYRIHGLIDPDHEETGQDEFSWYVMGAGFDVPVSGITVTLNAPAAATKTVCFREAVHSMNCALPTPAESMTWTLDGLKPGENLRVEASFPAGTFTEAASSPSSRQSPMALTPATGAVSGVLVLAVVGTSVVLLVSRRGRSAAASPDAGLTLDSARPGEIRALVHQRADNEAIADTIVDLAARGYLVIQPQPAPGAVLTMLPHNPSGLAPYEVRLMETLFAGRTQVTDMDLTSPLVGLGLGKVKTELMKQLSVAPTRWFTGDPQMVRTRWLVAGVVLVLVGVVLWLPLALLFGWGLPPAVLALLGVAMMIASRWIPTLTAQGRAVRQQAIGLGRGVPAAMQSGITASGDVIRTLSASLNEATRRAAR